MNPQIDSTGAERWYNANGKLHRDDGPAFVSSDGQYRTWYKNGFCHRDDGPAMIRADGREFWYINGKEIKPIPNIICYLRKKLDENDC